MPYVTELALKNWKPSAKSLISYT